MRDITVDGNIKGVLHPGGKGVLIISHGFRGSMDGGGRAVRLAAAVAGEGIAVLRFAFTPLSSLSRQVAELEAVVAYARQEVSEDIILLGRSMGGCASLLAAARGAVVRGLILWSVPLDLQEVFTVALGRDNMAELQAGRPVRLNDEWGEAALTPDFYFDLLSHDLPAAVRALPALPVLLIHGEADGLVPVSQAKRAFALARQPKRLYIVPGGDHRFINGFALSERAVLDWLKDIWL